MGGSSSRQKSGGKAAAIAALSGVDSIEVREKASMIEGLTALMGYEFEMGNKYRVYKDGKEIFYAAESTGCCQRQLKSCFGDCAPWDLEMLYTENGAREKAFYMHRPFTCTLGPCNRPVVEVEDAGTGETLGFIRDPCSCFNLTFTVRDEKNDDILYANGGCCQWGLFCPLPCGPCATVKFNVTDTKGNDVGDIFKKVPGCCKFFFASDVDNYKINFQGVQKPEHKALLMALSIFIDFRYFNDNRNDEGADQPQE